MAFLPSVSTILRGLSFISVLTVSSLAGLLYSYQGKLIYPSSLPSGAREDQTRPSRYQLPFEELWLKTPDGERLHAWYIRKDRRQDRSPITFVMFQANAGNIAHRLPLAAILLKKLNCNVFMLSYRGYGLSTGQPSEKGIKIDAQVALDWVRANLHNDEGQRIVLYGQSLGGAVAIDAGVRNAAWISALILENTFLDIPSLIPSVLPPARFFTFLCTEIWSSVTRLPLLDRKRVNVLFLSGAKDELVPPTHMKRLYAACTADVKEWKEFKDGTHNDTCMKPGYFSTIASFLQRHLAHSTSFSREALSNGFSGEDEVGSPARVATMRGEDDIARQFEEESDEDEQDARTDDPAAGLRRRKGADSVDGAGSLGPGAVIQEIDDDDDDSSAAGRRVSGKL
ncbi:unnamed protein product [Parajaminaea phylloscopi]